MSLEVDMEKVAEYLKRAGLSEVHVGRLLDAGYLDAPASARYHLNESGGLAVHSMYVVDNILKLTPAVGAKWELERSPYLIGMLHDMVKCHCYRQSGGRWEYQDHRHGDMSHGDASLAYIYEDIVGDSGFDLNGQERLSIIYHMGAYGLDRNQLKYYSDAKRTMPREVLCTHWADDLAASADECGM